MIDSRFCLSWILYTIEIRHVKLPFTHNKGLIIVNKLIIHTLE